MRSSLAAMRSLSLSLILLVAAGCGDGSTGSNADGVGGDTSGDTAGDDGVAPTDTASTVVTTCLAPEGADPSGTDQLTDDLGAASVSVADRDACHRTYTLASTATRKDDLPASPREVGEESGFPTLRSGNDLLDGLHALALAEARENRVATITDGAFSQGGATPCGGDAGCFETGRKWTYVWTRDTSFAVDLGLAAIDPARALGSLLFKTSARRSGGDPQIVQDTGSGGSYPVSSDRVVWALGAWAVLQQLAGDAYADARDTALAVVSNTLEHDRAVVFDPATGLYLGETSFLDWRQQTYPGWTELDVTDIATSAALSTNVRSRCSGRGPRSSRASARPPTGSRSRSSSASAARTRRGSCSTSTATARWS